MWAHFRAWEVGPRPYAGRIHQATFPLTKLLVLARRWTWMSMIKPETQLKNAKLPKWQLIPLSCHNGNLAHIPGVAGAGSGPASEVEKGVEEHRYIV
jgi:hypothetical protein